MRKTILLGIAIASAFIIGTLTANPVVEAVGGWKEALGLHEGDGSAHHDVPEAQVYEVIGTTLIEAGETSNEVITLLCEDGDWMDNTDNINFVTNVDVFFDGSRLHDTDAMLILDPESVATTGLPLSKRIGYSVLPELQGFALPFDFDVLVTITILCNSPS